MNSDLKVTLSLVDDFSKRLSGVEGSLGSFGRSVDGIAGNVAKFASGLAALTAANQLKAMAQDAINFGSSINDMSNRLGLSTDAVQKWDYVAKQSGTSIDAMQGSFRSLTNQIFAANTGSKEAQNLFQALGVEYKDLNGKSRDAGEVFQDLALRLSMVQNETDRAAIASKLFGKSSQDVLAIIAQGRPELEKMISDTEKYGMILGKDAVKALDDAGDAQDRLNQSMKVLSATAMSQFAPGIVKATDALTGLIGKMKDPVWAANLKIFASAMAAPISGLWAYNMKALELVGLKSGNKKPEAAPEDLWSVATSGRGTADELLAKQLSDLDKKSKKTTKKQVDDIEKYGAYSSIGSIYLSGPAPAESDTEKRLASLRRQLQTVTEIQAASLNEQVANDKAAEAEREMIHERDMERIKEEQQARSYLTMSIINAAAQSTSAIISLGMAEEKDTRKRQAMLALIAFSETAAAAGLAWHEAFRDKTVGNFYVKLGMAIGTSAQALATGVSLAAQIKKQSFYGGGQAYPGLAMVGESSASGRNAELVRFNRPGQVYNAAQTRDIMRSQSSSTPAVFNFYDQSGNLTETVRTQIRSNAGSRLIDEIAKQLRSKGIV